MIFAGTGSRSFISESEERREQVKQDVLNFLATERLRQDISLMSGMSEGWDALMVEVALELKLPYEVVIPNKGYGDYYWRRNSLTGKNQINKFNEYVNGATKVTYTCTGIYKDGIHANLLRNQQMVDLADFFLVYNPKTPGTRHCFNLLMKKKLPYKIFK